MANRVDDAVADEQRDDAAIASVLSSMPKGLVLRRLAFLRLRGPAPLAHRAEALVDRLGLRRDMHPYNFGEARPHLRTVAWNISGGIHLWNSSAESLTALGQLAAPPLSLRETDITLDLTHAGTLEPFAIGVLAAQLRRLRAENYTVDLALSTDNPSNRFAVALGLSTFPSPTVAAEPERTVSLRTLSGYPELEKFALDVARRVALDDAEVLQATKYTLVELLRNVFDHSGDAPTVVAQLMHKGRGHRERDSVQIVVADAGRGLLASLHPMHSWVTSDSVALNAAFSPFISRTFPEGRYAEMKDNAGLGLFFISELVKRSNGRLLVWSGERARVITGNPDEEAETSYIETDVHLPRLGGTLAVVEFELGLIEDYMSFFGMLRERVYRLVDLGEKGVQALERLTEAPLPGSTVFAVRDLAEDTFAARTFRHELLLPAITHGKRVVLDFAGYDALSPSFAHALVHEALREAALRDATLAVANAAEPVWQTLLQVQRYALAGAGAKRG